MATLDDASHNADIPSPYGYAPSEAAGIAMVVVFALSTLLHLGNAAYFKKWWIVPTIFLCGILETLGWAGRLWSHYHPPSMSAFPIKITSLILAGTPLLAAVFVVFAQVISKLGFAYSRLTPKYYTIVFLSCDIVALVVQGIGGGIVVAAHNNNESPALGVDIMLVGIAFQLAVIVVFSVCTIEYVTRYLKDKPIRPVEPSEKAGACGGRGALTGAIQLMLWALALNTTLLLIRAVYRTMELEDGWDGKIMTTERLFIVLDGVMIVLAMYVFNIVLPWWFSAERKAPAGT